MDNCQSEQSIEPHVSKESIEEEPEGKEDNESENNGSSISTPMESTSKGSGKKRKNVFVPEIKAKKKKQVLGRTFDHLSKTLGNLTDVIKDDSSQLFVEVSREDAKRQERRDEMIMAISKQMLCKTTAAKPIAFTDSFELSHFLWRTLNRLLNLPNAPSDTIHAWLKQ